MMKRYAVMLSIVAIAAIGIATYSAGPIVSFRPAIWSTGRGRRRRKASWPSGCYSWRSFVATLTAVLLQLCRALESVPDSIVESGSRFLR